MLMTKDDVDRYFQLNEEVDTGARQTKFKIIDILQDCIIIHTTQAKNLNEYSLRYEYLTAVFRELTEIETCVRNGTKMDACVGKALGKHGLVDNTRETYLYGLARELRDRKLKGKN